MTNQYNPEKTQGLNASAYFYGDFYEILTSSGRGVLTLDPDAPRYYLSVVVTDFELGECLLKALSLSKVWTSECLQNYLNTKEHERIGEMHVKEVMQQFNYKTKKDYFKKLHYCRARQIEDNITISPSHHYKLDSYKGVGTRHDQDKVNVILSANSTPTEIGAALRLAFSRCTSNV